MERHFDRHVKFKHQPSRPAIVDALRAYPDGNVAYNGPYTGPGPSTNRMYEQAGWDTHSTGRTTARLKMYPEDDRERSLSIRIEHMGGTHGPGTALKRYRINFNRSAGPADYVTLYEET